MDNTVKAPSVSLSGVQSKSRNVLRSGAAGQAGTSMCRACKQTAKEHECIPPAACFGAFGTLNNTGGTVCELRVPCGIPRRLIALRTHCVYLKPWWRRFPGERVRTAKGTGQRDPCGRINTGVVGKGEETLSCFLLLLHEGCVRPSA